MSVYQALEPAMDGKDPERYIGLLHDDFSRQASVRNHIGQGGHGRHDPAHGTRGGMAVHDQRCLYENGDIVVEHGVMDFPDGPGKR